MYVWMVDGDYWLLAGAGGGLRALLLFSEKFALSILNLWGTVGGYFTLKIKSNEVC
jgi:hypothetical protein